MGSSPGSRTTVGIASPPAGFRPMQRLQDRSERAVFLSAECDGGCRRFADGLHRCRGGRHWTELRDRTALQKRNERSAPGLAPKRSNPRDLELVRSRREGDSPPPIVERIPIRINPLRLHCRSQGQRTSGLSGAPRGGGDARDDDDAYDEAAPQSLHLQRETARP